MYSKLKEVLKLSQNLNDEELFRVCNDYYWAYKRIFDNTQSNDVKKLAKQKMEHLRGLMQNEKVPVLYTTYNRYEAIIGTGVSETEQKFNKMTVGNLSALEQEEIKHSIAKMPESANKCFLQASLIKASEANSVDSFRRMADFMGGAVQQDPSNFVYKQCLNDIRASIDSYEQAYNAWERAERERIDREKRIETTKKVASGVGKGILAVLGVIGTAIVGLLGLCCESIECCDC